jgi:hypothetical protein
MCLVIPGILAQFGGTLSSGQGAGRFTVLVALVLGVALGLTIASLMCAIHLGRQNQRLRRTINDLPVHWSRRRRWHPSACSGPCLWLAIRDSHPHEVQAALRLHNPTPCSWEEGLSAAHEQKLFISPPVGGWTLVMGASLPDPAEDVDACFHFVRELSEKLGQVQLFGFNRGLQHHAWVQAEQGAILRAYAWAGRTLWNQGPLTEAERDLGLTCLEYGEIPEHVPCGQPHGLAANTERVTLLAARWSVNPSAIDLRFVKAGNGIAGRLSSSQPQ